MGAAKGGKGTGTAVSAPKQRTRVTARRVTGTLAEWKGSFGWITPLTAVDHPEASKHRGRIYLAHEDVEEEISGVGANLSFFVYTDGNGLGAQNVKPAVVAPVQKIIQKPLTSTLARGAVKGVVKGLGRGTSQTTKGASKGASLQFPAAALSKGLKGKGKGKGKKERGPSGPDLPRERVSEDPLMGEVVDWKGKYGWITPQVPIEHADKDKNGGRIYINIKDLPEGAEMEIGKLVEFYLFKDAAGLGAEECTPL
uniref:Uncharacterized protein n=1 Tax=Noctiluca scintillans TaxID=2966 RepID=A0A7S1F880_NOCSC|eukprot:CAMPEP_0194479474 /NCGR_PEP_ID=MMETSP0253-20130528/2580_1 /TAXON_ID=2966 /ORGANISM="Noctiluca scintillans" /LENGTH=253 /DNA_ID=CAMNT_0039318703 /DNA_START=56 /DNA_END=817 /DNA_ORIENTATION=+